jgi:uncharacterized membrane protein YesL
MTAFRTLWMALVSLYEETLTLVGANLGALALNLPLGLLVFLIALLAPAFQDDVARQWLIGIVLWLMLYVPTPGNIALAGVARVAAGPDVPRLGLFRETLRTRWRLALQCCVLSLVVMAALIWNVFFYFTVGTGLLRLVSILWLYATLFWLAVHLYVGPLLVHVAEPRLLDIYRRSALVVLGHPGYTILLLVSVLALGFLSVVFLPVYVLIAGAYVSLVQAHALREIRRRHGDLPLEAEEEVYRL